MLKKISGLFLGLVVLAGSACVTPTHASSAPTVIIVSIEAATQTGAKNELVTLYNTTDEAIDITNWCLTNKSAAQFACFHDEGTVHTFLLPHEYATVASENYLIDAGLAREEFSLVYTVTNQSSGSIVNSSDTVSLIDADNQVIDTKTWSSAIPTARVLARVKLFSQPDTYAVVGGAGDWSYSIRSALPSNGVVLREVIPEPAEDSPPDSPSEEGVLSSTALPLRITELLPDAKGSDTNNEFIELFNPNSQVVSLANYRLLIGSSLEKSYQFPAGLVIEPGAYSAIYNNVVKYSLNNTAGKVGLSLEGKPVDEGVSYNHPNEGEAWAVFENEWAYTNRPTPGQPNLSSLLEVSEAEPKDTTQAVQKPCAANQYRNAETGRCRLIVTSASKLPTPCKEGQERNAETNRCRAAQGTSTKTPCKANQTRSVETGRCRTVKSMPKVGYGLKEAKVTQKSSGVSWYMWVAIGGVVAIIVGYGVWEWRAELRVLRDRLVTAILKK